MCFTDPDKEEALLLGRSDTDRVRNFLLGWQVQASQGRYEI